MKRLLPALLLSAMLLGGCAFKDKLYTPSEVEKKLAEFCLKEGKLAVTTHIVKKTLWIYSAFDESIFTVKPSSTQPREKKTTPFELLYIGGEYDGQKNFALNYDMVPDGTPSDPSSYGTAYNENYTKKRQLMYQALQESVFNMTPQDAPDFIVVIIADIKTGVATKSTIYLSDLKQYMTEAIPPDEYYLRENNEIFGNKDLIGDSKGKSLQYADIRWTSFLVDQMKTRVKFRFTQSDFPPETDPDKEITGCAADTLRFYPFTDYNGVYLYNIRAKKDMLFNKTQLKTFEGKSWWEGKGKLTTIHFDASPEASAKKPGLKPTAARSSFSRE